MTKWTDRDFERLSWHDCLVHGMHDFTEAGELRFDLDYITQWVHPGPDEVYFSFWIAPATLVFHKAHDLHVSLAPPDSGTFVIMRMTREATRHEGVFEFGIETLGGGLRLRASGFAQYLRASPVLRTSQNLDLGERGGVSFSIPAE